MVASYVYIVLFHLFRYPNPYFGEEI